MKGIFKQYGFYIFIAIAALQIIAIHFNFPALRFISKPLLMPVLAIVVYSNCEKCRERNLIIAALLFSFSGDSFLLLEDKQPLFFIFGLVSFLITHLLYIIYFLGIKPLGNSLLKTHPYLPLLIAGFGAGLIYLLYPWLGEMKIPVMVYAAIICSMLLCSFYMYKSVKQSVGLQFIAGAVLFVLSDSLLAINKFYQPFQFAAILIMLTYCGAQYCIVRGFIKQKKKTT